MTLATRLFQPRQRNGCLHRQTQVGIGCSISSRYLEAKLADAILSAIPVEVSELIKMFKELAL